MKMNAFMYAYVYVCACKFIGTTCPSSLAHELPVRLHVLDAESTLASIRERDRGGHISIQSDRCRVIIERCRVSAE